MRGFHLYEDAREGVLFFLASKLLRRQHECHFQEIVDDGFV